MKALRPLLVGVLIATVPAILAGCGGAVEPQAAPAPATLAPFPTPTPAPTVATKPPASTAQPVRESDIINFTLEDFTVSVGTTVTWINRDGEFHTTTSGIPLDKDGIWDSSILDQNQRFSFTFDQPGVFPYWCWVHSDMTATITVAG